MFLPSTDLRSLLRLARTLLAVTALGAPHLVSTANAQQEIGSRLAVPSRWCDRPVLFVNGSETADGGRQEALAAAAWRDRAVRIAGTEFERQPPPQLRQAIDKP